MRKTLTASAKAPAAREYEYGFGLYNGRFQILHEGHVANFKALAKKCQRPIINIGSINQSRDTRNFLDFQERKSIGEPAITGEFAADTRPATSSIGQEDPSTPPPLHPAAHIT